MVKTLVGKENYLFLINDGNKELEIHCNNLCQIDIKKIIKKKYFFKNYLLIVFPDKSIYFKDKLPENYNAKFRPALEINQKIFKNKLLDTYQFLKNEKDYYYKTDTHINFKGNYLVYCEAIKKINKIYDLNFKIKEVQIEKMENVILKNLTYGVGDLTWDINAKDLNLPDIYDNFYYSNDIPEFYPLYKIKSSDGYKFYNYKLIDKTIDLENNPLSWDIISNYIIHYKEKDINNNEPKILIFHDSFLLSAYHLYFYSFKNVYFIKKSYTPEIINLVKPDYVFEFRVERFL